MLSLDGIEFALLDVQTTSKLLPLLKIPGVRCEAVVENRTVFKRKTKLTVPFEVSVNIFGPKQAMDEVFKALSQTKTFLQHPQTLSDDIEYFNPEMLVFSGQETNMNDLIGTYKHFLQGSQLSRDVKRILESLSGVADVDELSYFDGLNSEGLGNDGRLGHLYGLVTTPTTHQEDGVRFILMRENDLCCSRLSQNVMHVTGIESPPGDAMQSKFGGLVADVMGIGKTLTMLISILHTASKAQDFQLFRNPTSAPKFERTPTKATLVITPSVRKSPRSATKRLQAPAHNMFRASRKLGI